MPSEPCGTCVIDDTGVGANGAEIAVGDVGAAAGKFLKDATPDDKGVVPCGWEELCCCWTKLDPRAPVLALTVVTSAPGDDEIGFATADEAAFDGIAIDCIGDTSGIWGWCW